jgi:hypothetical protein
VVGGGEGEDQTIKFLQNEEPIALLSQKIYIASLHISSPTQNIILKQLSTIDRFSIYQQSTEFPEQQVWQTSSCS